MANPNEITVGDIRRLSATNIVDVNGSPADPTTLTLKVKKPDLSLTTYVYPGGDGTIVKDSLGNYHADIALDQALTWRYDWVGTGTAVFAEGATFYVSPQRTA
jgi:hypothetical protein